MGSLPSRSGPGTPAGELVQATFLRAGLVAKGEGVGVAAHTSFWLQRPGIPGQVAEACKQGGGDASGITALV